MLSFLLAVPALWAGLVFGGPVSGPASQSSSIKRALANPAAFSASEADLKSGNYVVAVYMVLGELEAPDTVPVPQRASLAETVQLLRGIDFNQKVIQKMEPAATYTQRALEDPKIPEKTREALGNLPVPAKFYRELDRRLNQEDWSRLCAYSYRAYLKGSDIRVSLAIQQNRPVATAVLRRSADALKEAMPKIQEMCGKLMDLRTFEILYDLIHEFHLDKTDK